MAERPYKQLDGRTSAPVGRQIVLLSGIGGRSTFSGGSVWRRQECYTLPIWLTAMGSADGLTDAHGPAGEEVGPRIFQEIWVTDFACRCCQKARCGRAFCAIGRWTSRFFRPTIGGGRLAACPRLKPCIRGRRLAQSHNSQCRGRLLCDKAHFLIDKEC